MKVQEVLLRAMNGQISWVQAGEILALCPRQVLRDAHKIDLSYSWVKKALQTAGLVPVSKRRGAHRRRRERRPLPGMLLHIDASRHAWVPGGMQDLVSVSDDATNELY